MTDMNKKQVQVQVGGAGSAGTGTGERGGVPEASFFVGVGEARAGRRL